MIGVRTEHRRLENPRDLLNPHLRNKVNHHLNQHKKKNYEGPAKVKEVNLAAPGETPKPVFVLVDLSKEEESDLITLLKEYKDCFAWSYKDMKAVPPEVVQHTIPIRDDAKPVQQRPYDMNPKYETIVKEEIDKLLNAGFIYEI